MSDCSLGIDDQHLMDKLQEIVPEVVFVLCQLRKQIAGSIRSKFEKNLQKAKQQKRRQLTQQYELRIKKKVEESNNEIKNSLATMVQMIDNYKAVHKQKNRHMSKEEEEAFIQQTVEEIQSDSNMIEEVKNRLRSKIQARVRTALQKQLEDGVQMGKRQLNQRLKQEREAWTEERIGFWRMESNKELQQLANEHNELNNKKLAIEGALATKRSQKSQLEQRLSMIMQKNAMVSNLKHEIKALKDSIRA